MLHILKILFPVALLLPVAVANSLDVPARDLTSLTAVTFRPIIQKREEAFILKRDCDHHYADHSSILRGAKSRFATTSMKYSLPTVNLEDIELHIADITCSNSNIAVEFRDYQTLEIAKKSWDAAPEFFVITSHAGCNNDGERAPYLVSSIMYAKDMPIAMLSTKRTGWDDAYEKMTVSFGTSQGKYNPDSIRLHTNLQKRQLIPTGVISYPTVTATPAASATAMTKSLETQVPAGHAVLSFEHKDGEVEEKISISCKNCSTAGTIEISQGLFTVNGSAFKTKIENFVEHGFFKAVANGVNAHIELDTTLSLSTGKTFTNNIAQFAIPGFQIPGIAAVGPILEFDLTGGIEIAADLDFTYGFDLTVPDNSSVVVNINNVTESTYQGFNDSQVTALPLTASSPDFSLTLDVGLVASLLVGISVFNNHADLGAGVFMNLPHLGLTIEQVNGLNADCESVDSDTTSGFLSTIFPNLTHIVPQADIDIGLRAEVGGGIEDIRGSFTDTHMLASASFPLPTKCLMWDDTNNAFTTPTTSATTTSSTGPADTGASKKTNLGTRSIRNPVLELGTLGWMLGMLLTTLFIAVSL